jgi:hypothetical protein
VTNVSSGAQVTTSPFVYLQVGFGVFDDFTTFNTGNVVGQSAWMANTASLSSVPVQILTINGTNEYVVPGGCPNASVTAQQPFKYVAAGPLTNAFNVVGGVSNNVPTFAITGMLITFTNAPYDANYVFSQRNVFHDWNDAGVIQNGGGYSWTTELNSDETGGGPEGTPQGINVYNFGQQYQVFFVSDFVGSNAWVFVNPGTNDLDYLLANSPSNLNPTGTGTNNSWNAAWSDGESDCSYCAGLNPQGWESITLGQYSGSGNNCDPVEGGYFVTRVAASTNYVSVYNWLNPPTNSTPSDPFTAWQQNYFPTELSNPSYSGPNASPVGTGYSNTNQFLLGFNPTNSATFLHIISVVRTNGNAIITYLGANGDNTYMPGFGSRTNILDFSTGTGNGSYTSTNFTSTGQTNILSGGTGLGIVTNMVDVGGATAVPARYYRVRVPLP